jgi:hypothetical protein
MQAPPWSDRRPWCADNRRVQTPAPSSAAGDEKGGSMTWRTAIDITGATVALALLSAIVSVIVGVPA